MTVRLLSVLVGVLADRFRTTTGDATRPAHPAALWSPDPGRIPGWSTTPNHAPVISQRFTATTDQVRPARNFVAEILGDDHPLRDDAVLLTSELATNAIEHSSGLTSTEPADTGTSNAGSADVTPVDRPREFVVTVAFTLRGVIVTVQDPGFTRIPTPEIPDPMPPAAEDSSSSTTSPPAGASTATS
ncbi:hypothetical protein [Streptosporangium sp. NPDC049046]|uniref:ATP-binding protein n=1 Tax=Streptosporangium sp. NPDC049046 TaxID=3155031 RepID=UPI00341FCDFB